MTKSKTDIRPDNPLMAFLPERFRPYALLARVDRPIGFWLLAMPGWWSIFLAIDGMSGGMSFGAAAKAVWLCVLFGVGAVAMRGAGCVVNDIWDRDLDRKVERTQGRPLAAGDLSLKQAFVFLLILLVVGLLVLVQMNAVTVVLGVISLPLIIAYPLMKRITWWPQAFLGLTFNFGVLMGWSAMAEQLSPSAALLYAGAILWTIGYDTIYAYQDKEDDLIAGIKSTALRFGARAKIWVGGFYGGSFALMALAFWVHNPVGSLFLLPAGVHLLWQMRRWSVDDKDSALYVFKANRDYGLLVLLAAILSAVFL